MGRVRVYIREDYSYSREWFYQPTDEEFLESVKDFVEEYQEEYGEDFTPENLLTVFKGESDMFDIHEITQSLYDYHGGYDFFGDYIEDYGDCPDSEIETDPEEARFWFKTRRQEVLD